MTKYSSYLMISPLVGLVASWLPQTILGYLRWQPAAISSMMPSRKRDNSLNGAPGASAVPSPPRQMALIAVEYITSMGLLEGNLFNFDSAPIVWPGPVLSIAPMAWRPNPPGGFAGMNPNATCEHATAK
jgi:hypothetical protein